MCIRDSANTFQSKKIMVGDKTIDIPLIALISHHYLAMDNVQIKFKAKVCLLYTSQNKCSDDNAKSAQTTIFIKRCVLAKKVFVIFWALNGIYLSLIHISGVERCLDLSGQFVAVYHMLSDWFINIKIGRASCRERV